MDFKKEIYKVEFTDDCRDEIRAIYKYISENLVAKPAARRLMQKMKKSIMNLAEFPKLCAKIEKNDRRKREFRKLIVNHYVILYTIDENKKTVYISHMYYGASDYYKNITTI